MRRIGLFLAVLVATMVGAVSSAAAGIRELGRPYRIGSNVLVFSPNGRWLATLDTAADGDPRPLRVMSVNATTGGLHRARGAPFAVGSALDFGGQSVAFSPDSRLLVVSAFTPSAGSAILVFSVNRRTGAWHPVSRWVDPNGPVASIAFSPRGGLLAAADGGGIRDVPGGISLLTVKRTTGVLRYTSRWVGSNAMQPALLASDGMSFNSRGNLLAVSLTDFNNDYHPSVVAIFAVKQRTRTLALVAHYRFGETSGEDDLAFSPDGRLLALSVWTDDKVAVLRVNQTTGALDVVPGSPFGTGATPESLAFSRDGGLLAVVNAGGRDFSVFFVNKSTGTLHSVPGSPFGRSVRGYVGDWIAFSPRANLLAYGAGIGSPNGTVSPQRVAVFSIDLCSDPDHDRDCD
ncbi:MAG: beta-propeller fold lactonase family protein [Solirubrobacteraceae bacterium]